MKIHTLPPTIIASVKNGCICNSSYLLNTHSHLFVGTMMMGKGAGLRGPSFLLHQEKKVNSFVCVFIQKTSC